MTLEQLSHKYDDHFIADAEVVLDGAEIKHAVVYIDGRESVSLQYEDEVEAIAFLDNLLEKWDFSFHLDFNSLDEAYAFIK